MKAFRHRHYIGLAVSTLWIIVAGGVFGGLALSLIGTAQSTELFIAVIVVAIVLSLITITIIIRVVRSAAGLPPRTPEEKIIGRRFGRMVLLEVMAIMVVNGVVSILKRTDLIVPSDLIIVGIHFLPLASLFQVPDGRTLLRD